MDTFVIQLANDPRSHRVDAARWEQSDDYHLTSFDDGGKEIATWAPHEWYRLIEQAESGKAVDKFRNPTVPNPKS
jgi:hypothetical protein